ncbi:MAG: hypothetical protein KTR30_23240, partial [Saprospiraceae bacterium]|nr:hypothetical protein [Saprospiraceae bacterium]
WKLVSYYYLAFYLMKGCRSAQALANIEDFYKQPCSKNRCHMQEMGTENMLYQWYLPRKNTKGVFSLNKHDQNGL